MTYLRTVLQRTEYRYLHRVAIRTGTDAVSRDTRALREVLDVL
jgi:hypothetical protein